MRFDDIAPFGGDPPADESPADRRPVRAGKPSRRAVLRGISLTGMALAMQVVGTLPLQRAEAANSYGYRLINNASRCHDFNCVPGCGPSKVCGSTNYENYGHCCAHYRDVQGVAPNGYWHADGDLVDEFGDTHRYRLRPGQCYGADAWIWRIFGCRKVLGGCGTAVTTTFRCHDGWYKLNGTGNAPSSANGWTKTICKHRYVCPPYRP